MSPSQPVLNHVLIIKDRGGPRAYWLTAEMYSIGRDPSNTIRVDSQYASRRHAILFKSPSDTIPGEFVYQIIDGDVEGNPSTNGLFVNGRRTDFCDLTDGDEIQFASDANAKYAIQQKTLDDILSTYEHTEVSILGS